MAETRHYGGRSRLDTRLPAFCENSFKLVVCVCSLVMGRAAREEASVAAC